MTTGARLNASFLMPVNRKSYDKRKCLVCRKMLKASKKKTKTQICSSCQVDFNSRYSSKWVTLINYFGKKVDEAYNKGLKDCSQFHGKVTK